MAVLVTWMSFASCRRELRGGVLSMLETHIMMSSLMFHLNLILVFRLARTSSHTFPRALPHTSSCALP
jgi:hypothetical protein